MIEAGLCSSALSWNSGSDAAGTVEGRETSRYAISQPLDWR